MRYMTVRAGAGELLVLKKRGTNNLSALSLALPVPSLSLIFQGRVRARASGSVRAWLCLVWDGPVQVRSVGVC